MTPAGMPADSAGLEVTPPDPLTLAQRLAAIGIASVPARRTADGRKMPTTPRGILDATADPHELVDLWTQYGQGATLVGVHAGRSGLVVVDIDRHPGGPDGYAALAAAGVNLPATLAHRSLSGQGEHLVYAAPAGEWRGHNEVPGVNVIADGHVVWSGPAPASRADLAPAPEWTLRARRPASDDAPTWPHGVDAWQAANRGEPAGAVAAALDRLPEHGALSEPDLYGYALGIVRAAVFDLGGAAAMDALRDRYASPPWDGALYRHRVERAIERAVAAEGRASVAGLPAIEFDGLGVPAIVRDAEQIVNAEATRMAAPFRVLTRDEIRERPRPPWLIENTLQGAGVIVLAGPGGIGKSFLALDFAASIATGTSWHGRAVRRLGIGAQPDGRQPRVLYVAAEGVEFFPDRLDAWEMHNSAKVPDDGLLFVESGFSLSDPAAVAHMRELVAAEEFDLIILDTLSQLSAVVSENDNAEVSGVIRQGRAIREARAGASVLILHHVSKGDRGRVRGASAIRDNADQVIVARAEGDGFALSTRVEDDGKMKNAPAWWMGGFRLADVGSSAVVVRDQPAVDAADAAIATVLADGEGHPLADFLARVGDTSEATARRVRRRLDAAIESGQVGAEGVNRGRRYRLSDT